MTLFKALSLSEEWNCYILHRESGTRFRSMDVAHDELRGLPAIGWEIDDTPYPVSFKARLLGIDKIDVSPAGGRRGTVYSFEGSESFTYLPAGILVEVKITPL